MYRDSRCWRGFTPRQHRRCRGPGHVSLITGPRGGWADNRRPAPQRRATHPTRLPVAPQRHRQPACTTPARSLPALQQYAGVRRPSKWSHETAPRTDHTNHPRVPHPAPRQPDRPWRTREPRYPPSPELPHHPGKGCQANGPTLHLLSTEIPGRMAGLGRRTIMPSQSHSPPSLMPSQVRAVVSAYPPRLIKHG